MLKAFINDNLPVVGLTKPFDEIGKDDAETAGGKGASLGEMTQAGIPVPPGFVVLADAFERFIEETGLVVEIDAILDTVDHAAMHTVENASEQIQGLILAAAMPNDLRTEIEESFARLDTEFVAVRSSATAEDGATAAWAGQLDTYLNTTQSTLLENVQRCWASLFTPRAIFYRFEKGLDTQKISVAVVVQKMVNSDAAGIAFSVHPVTEDYNQMIIEAGFGLGEAVVSGQITPDSYVVTKDKREIIEKSISEQAQGLFRKSGGGNEWRDIPQSEGSKQVLSDEQILALGETLIGIERHYDFPVDTEWAVEGKEVYIVQSRPITTLSTQERELDTDSDVVQLMNRSGSSVTHVVDNYTLTFESGGIGTLMSEIICAGYLPAGSLIIYRNGTYEQYYSNAGLEEMGPKGIEFFSMEGYAEQLVKDLKALIASATDAKKDTFQRSDIENLFKTFTEIHRKYNAFDFGYTDGAYSVMDSNDVVRKNVERVEEEKNAIREEYNILFFDENGALAILLKNLSERFSVPVSNLQWYIASELFDLLTSKKVAEDVLEERKRAYVFRKAGESEEYTFLYGKDAINFSSKFGQIKVVEDKSQVIRGVVASGGNIVRGVVFNLTTDYSNVDQLRAQMALMKQGEILVAPTTAPEHMDAIRKSAAMVVDVGGMLSHTAIVGRELGIPSIVGTQYGSKVFKTGDEVEVDADTGTVRLIGRSTKEVTLVKFFSRDHSLFYTYVWRTSNTQRAKKWVGLNIEEALYAHPAGGDVVEVWYSDNELKRYDAAIAAKILSDTEWFQALAAYFETEWQGMLRLIQKKEVLTREELSEFYDHWVNWWDPMAFTMQIPEIEGVPQDIKDQAFNLRASTQEYSDSGDELFHAYMQQNHPELSKYFSVVTPEEVFSDTFPSHDVLEQRLGGWYMTSSDFGLIDDLPRALKERNFVLEKVDTTAIKELTGQVAYKGIARGRVRVLSRRDQVSEVQEGEILVATMTTPDFFPALQKAAAFITDEGGITCHAAIVAREMKKPCIIGTKIATQVLQDGDEVEVDADTGVVRILQKEDHQPYVFFYESQGYAFILEDMIMSSYVSWPMIVLGVGTRVRKYVPAGTPEELKVQGLTHSAEDLETRLASIQEILGELRSISLTVDMSKEECLEVFAKMEEILELYSYFDTAYCEGLYSDDLQDPRALVVEQSKNVIRDDLDGTFFRENGVLDMLLTAVGTISGISSKDIRWHRLEEIKRLLDQGESVSELELDNRRRNYFSKRDASGHITLESGDIAYLSIEAFEEQYETEPTSTLKGTVAHGKGKKITAKACIINRDYSDHKKLVADMEAMEEGSILVTTTTDPEFMPALRKAGAIVTDIGGLLSHAAISARELDTPCIVGTENATKAISTGDLVEMDANTGVVRILT